MEKLASLRKIFCGPNNIHRFFIDKMNIFRHCRTIVSSIIGRWRLRETCAPACSVRRVRTHMVSAFHVPIMVPIALIVATLIAAYVVSLAIYQAVPA